MRHARRLCGPAAGHLALIIAVTLGAVGPASGQEPSELVLTGQVVDASSRVPLLGAAIQVEGVSGEAFTDPDGRFSIPAPERDGAVTVTLLGYQGQYLRTSEFGVGQHTVELEPDPFLLEGISVVADRFESRRNAAPTTSRAFTVEDFVGSGTHTAQEFLERRLSIREADCAQAQERGSALGFGTAPVMRDGATSGCARLRGRVMRMTICIDEAPAHGGFYQLNMIEPDEMYLIEVYDEGRMIRLYTNEFMRRAATHGFDPTPLNDPC